MTPLYNDEGLTNNNLFLMYTNLILMSLQARGHDCQKFELYEIISRCNPSQKLRIANMF